MLIFPGCKINLGLLITGKREDGYHNIETIFYPVPIKDALEIIHKASNTTTSPALNFTLSGFPISGEKNNNLCIKAWHLLKQDFPRLPEVQMHLHKAVPMGAGLGGGSADAAFTLIALNEKYTLGLNEAQLLAYALQLGSDCPFFIINKPCIATGRGEKLIPVQIDLSSYRLILVNPGVHIDTRWAFSQINITSGRHSATAFSHNSLLTVISKPINQWKHDLVNNFERPVFEKYREIGGIKQTLYKSGALYASMSGSGSSVYGIFERTAKPTFNFPENYFFWDILL